MRVVFTDGEMTNLDADGWGQLLCASVAEYGGNPKRPWHRMETFLLKDFKKRRWDDRGLALQWRNRLEAADVIVTWNGIKFDLPFLNTRLRSYGLRETRVKRHKDLMYTARFKLRLSSASLKNVQAFLRIEQRYGCGKTELDKNHWRKAMTGVSASYQYIVRHNIEDVKVLACAWEELKDIAGEIK